MRRGLRTKQRKLCSEEAMASAVKAATSREYSTRHTAEQYNEPRWYEDKHTPALRTSLALMHYMIMCTAYAYTVSGMPCIAILIVGG